MRCKSILVSIYEKGLKPEIVPNISLVHELLTEMVELGNVRAMVWYI